MCASILECDLQPIVNRLSLLWLSNVDMDGAGVRVAFVFGDVDAMRDLREGITRDDAWERENFLARVSWRVMRQGQPELKGTVKVENRVPRTTLDDLGHCVELGRAV
jgi:hypothetical protein